MKAWIPAAALMSVGIDLVIAATMGPRLLK